LSNILYLLGVVMAQIFAYTEVHAHFWTGAILPIFLIEIGITKEMAKNFSSQ
jgi:hypothetical protein